MNGASVDKSSHRKRWSQQRNDIIMTPRRHERVPVAKQMEPSPGYDEYLFLLQQRNKMLQKVKLTDKEQLEREKKEKGFTLYVNGANDDKMCKKTRRKTPNPSPRVTSNARIVADLDALARKTPSANEDLSIQIPSLSSRSRSAPESAKKSARRNWNASSVNIQTARGDKMHLHAPDMITGNYTEDFEEASVTDSINNIKSDDDDDDSTIRESINSKSSTKHNSDEDGNSLDASISDHVLLSINDVSKLRKSLELSKFVRESICQDMDEDEQDSDTEEEIADLTGSAAISAGDTIILEFAPKIKSSSLPHRRSQVPVKTPRPLSSVKRASAESSTESLQHRSEVFSALADENKRISEYRQKHQEGSKKVSGEERVGNPLINSFMLNTDEGMRQVEDRVLQMEPKQQRQLIKSLYQLERTVRPSSTALTTRDGKHDRAESKDTEVHKVMLELMSNWGAKNLVGLTEIMVLDECNQRIEVNTSFLRVDGAKNCVGNAASLFNNRYRTVKDRNMFCCVKAGQRPVSLSFRVEIPLGSQINKIKFWNYNKSLAELGVGVKRLRISIDDDIIYDGDIEKGCGNQVFDYGHTIVVGSDGQDDIDCDVNIQPNTLDPNSSRDTSRQPVSQKESPRRLHHPDHSLVRKSSRESSEMWIPLSTTPEPVERSKTRLLLRSTDGVLPPTVTSSNSEDEIDTYNNSGSKVRSKNLAGSDKTGRDSIGPSAKPPLPQSHYKGSSASNSMTKPVRSSTQAKLPWMDKDVDLMTSLAQRSPSPVSNHVQSIDEGSKKTSKVLPEWIEKSKTDPLRSSLDDMLEALDKWEPVGYRKEDLKTVFDEAPIAAPQPSKGIPTKVASEEEEENYRKSASKEMNRAQRRRANQENMAASRRKKWQQPSVDLEASWTSLDLFAKSHRGRISMEGDALDEYLRGVGTPGTGITVDGSTPATDSEQGQVEHTVTTQPAAPLQAISEEDPFIIPELPCGQNLVINIKTTWGDRYYVGLNGVEFFADNGEPISISKVAANPRDINVLPDYRNDPRVITNIVDGVNKTRDDIHMWLAPFSEGLSHYITLTFTKPSRLALMRIWNYNKSRIHSYRGAKDIEILLDGNYIFKGEIARACGGTQGGTEAFGDTILFTMSDAILDAVSRHDGQYEGGNFSDEWEDDVPYDDRPATADKGNSDRPHTSVDMKFPAKSSVHHSIQTPPAPPSGDQQGSVAMPVSVDGTTLVYKAKEITLNFTETWGDPHYLGLTGLEVVSKDGEAIPLTLSMLVAQPEDLHVLPGYETDDRTLDKLIDGENTTVSDEHMWLIPYTEGENHTLTITLQRSLEVVGLRFWNYNKSAEDTYRGAKTVHVLLDECTISPPQGFLIRKGPGNCYYDFAQELLFSDILRCARLDSQLSILDSAIDAAGDDPEDYVISRNMPKGFVYQFHLLSSQSDLYYVGLNAIEVFDAEGKKIELDENNLAAYPESVNVLDGIEGDIRTPDKLVNGINDTNNGDHMWLAPILPGIINRLFVIFDYPQTVSMIKIWNYSKTPNRGAKEFALLVDDLLVYNGVLGPLRYGTGILPNSIGPQHFHTILFTNDERIKARVKSTIVSNKSEELDVQLTNDNLVMSKPASKQQKSADQTLRPKTSLQKRPTGRRR